MVLTSAISHKSLLQNYSLRTLVKKKKSCDALSWSEVKNCSLRTLLKKNFVWSAFVIWGEKLQLNNVRKNCLCDPLSWSEVKTDFRNWVVGIVLLELMKVHEWLYPLTLREEFYPITFTPGDSASEIRPSPEAGKKYTARGLGSAGLWRSTLLIHQPDLLPQLVPAV